MSLPTIYNFDHGNKIYLGAGTADADPLDPAGFLMPAFSTLVAPPTIPDGQVAVYDEDSKTWALAAQELFQPEALPQVPVSLDQLKLTAQAEVDSYFEILYQTSIPTPAMTKEYESAYLQAKAWLQSLAGGVVIIVPARVEALAETMSMQQATTNQQAAQYVVAKYNEAESVLDKRGAARLRAKAAIRAATDAVGVAAALAAGKDAMGQITMRF